MRRFAGGGRVIVRGYRGRIAAFSTRHAEAKVQRILRKTWNKMSPAGQQAALKLRLPDDVRALIGRSVGATD
jgi:hypothetical protein